ncbi:hypothetical protein [uncultured Mobiluncus sp.]|uniref:hypothetical protein n=1 Tax=uncultured Mobiluncus sp. TaxID=293425 RepID=UPI002631F5E0|nr:hypothetical protein [uncultured Mobiluncus sp.]
MNKTKHVAATVIATALVLLGVTAPPALAGDGYKIAGLVADKWTVGAMSQTGEWYVWGKRTLDPSKPVRQLEPVISEPNISLPSVLPTKTFKTASGIGNIGIDATGSVYCTSLSKEYTEEPEGLNFNNFKQADTSVCPYGDWGWVSFFDDKNIKYVASNSTGGFWAANDTTIWGWGHQTSGSLGLKPSTTTPSPLRRIVGTSDLKPTRIIQTSFLNAPTIVNDKFESASLSDFYRHRADPTWQIALKYVGVPLDANQDYKSTELSIDETAGFYFVNEDGKLKIRDVQGRRRTDHGAVLTGIGDETTYYDSIFGEGTVAGLPDTTNLKQLYFTSNFALAVIGGRTYIWGAQDDGSFHKKDFVSKMFTTPHTVSHCGHSTSSLFMTGCFIAHAPEEITSKLGGSTPVVGGVHIRGGAENGLIRVVGENGKEYSFDAVKGYSSRNLGNVSSPRPIREISGYDVNSEGASSFCGIYTDGTGFLADSSETNFVVKTFTGRDGGQFLSVGGATGLGGCQYTYTGKFTDDISWNNTLNRVDYKPTAYTNKAPQDLNGHVVQASYNGHHPRLFMADFSGKRYVYGAGGFRTYDVYGNSILDENANTVRQPRQQHTGGLVSKFAPITNLHPKITVDYNRAHIRVVDQSNGEGYMPGTFLDYTVTQDGQEYGKESPLFDAGKDKMTDPLGSGADSHLIDIAKWAKLPAKESTVTVTTKLRDNVTTCTNGSCFATVKDSSPTLQVVSAETDTSGKYKVVLRLDRADSSALLQGATVKAKTPDGVVYKTDWENGGCGMVLEKNWVQRGEGTNCTTKPIEIVATGELIDKTKPADVVFYASNPLHEFKKPAGQACPVGVKYCVVAKVPTAPGDINQIEPSMAPVSIDPDGAVNYELKLTNNNKKLSTPVFDLGMEFNGTTGVEGASEYKPNSEVFDYPATVKVPAINAGETWTGTMKVKPKTGMELAGDASIAGLCFYKPFSKKYCADPLISLRKTPRSEGGGSLSAPSWSINTDRNNYSGLEYLTIDETSPATFADGTKKHVIGKKEAGPVVVTAPAQNGPLTIPVTLYAPFYVGTFNLNLVDASRLDAKLVPDGVTKDGKRAKFVLNVTNTGTGDSPVLTWGLSMGDTYKGNPVFAEGFTEVDITGGGASQAATSSTWAPGVIAAGKSKQVTVLVDKGAAESPIDTWLQAGPQGRDCPGGAGCARISIGDVQAVLSSPDMLPAPGQEGTWVLKLSNLTEGDAYDVVVVSADSGDGSDLWQPKFVDPDGEEGPVVVSADGKTVTIPKIAAGATTGVNILAQVKGGVSLQDGVKHTVRVSTLLSKTASKDTEVKDTSQLQVDLADSGGEVVYGQPHTWKATIKNPTEKPVTGVKVEFATSQSMKDLKLDGIDGTTWNVGDLAGGETKTITLTATPIEDPSGKWTISGKASSTLLPTLDGCRANEGLDADDDRCDIVHVAPAGKLLVHANVEGEPKAGEKALVKVSVQGPASGAKNVLIKTSNGKWVKGKFPAGTTGDDTSWTIPELGAGEKKTATIEVQTGPDDVSVAVKVGKKLDPCVSNDDLSSDSDECDVAEAKLGNGAKFDASTTLVKGDKAKAGQPVEWKITIRNTGVSTADMKATVSNTPGMEGAKIVDASKGKTVDKAWSIEKLQPGGEATATIAMLAPVGMNRVEGSLNVAGGAQATIISFKVDLTLPPTVPKVDVSTKWLRKDGTKDVWQVKVTNPGPEEATDIRIQTGARDPEWGTPTVGEIRSNEWVLDRLPAGDSATVELKTVGQDNVTVWANGGNRPTPPDGCGTEAACSTGTIPDPTPAGVVVSKKFVDTTSAGDVWQITVKNTGSEPVKDIQIVDTIPGASWGVPTAGNTDSGMWQIGLLPAGGEATVQVTTKGTDSNQAYAQTREGRDPGDCTKACAKTERPKPDNNKGVPAGVKVTKTWQSKDKTGGDVWTVTVTNTNTTPVADIKIRDTVKGATFAPTPRIGKIVDGAWVIDLLPAGQIVTNLVTTKGTDSNLAYVETSEGRPGIVDAQSCTDEGCASASTPAGKIPDTVKVTKTFTKTQDGADVWTVTVTNTGNKPVVGVTVVDAVKDATWVKTSGVTVEGNRATLGTLPAGDTKQLQVKTKNVSENFAWVETGGQRTISSVGDCVTACGMAKKPKPTDPLAKIVLKTGEPTQSGKTLSWKVTVTNNGTTPVEGANIHVSLPLENLRIEAGDASGTSGGKPSMSNVPVAGKTPMGGGAGMATAWSKPEGGGSGMATGIDTGATQALQAGGKTVSKTVSLPVGDTTVTVTGIRVSDGPVSGPVWVGDTTVPTNCTGSCVVLSAPGVKKDEPQPSQSPSPEVPAPEKVDNNSGDSNGSGSDTAADGQDTGFGGAGIQGASPISGGGSGGGLAVTGANVETLTPWILFLLANGLIIVWRARRRSVEKLSRTQ